MTDIEQLITTSLRGRAGGDVDPAALLDAVGTQARARRRRSRMVAGFAGVAVVALAAGVVTLAPAVWNGAGTGDPGLRIGAPPQGVRVATALPVAGGVPGASAAPEQVGTDPTVVHFDAPAIIYDARHYSWTSGEGYEQLEAGIGRETLVYAGIGPGMAALDAAPRQGGHQHVLREQPVPGLWVRIEAPDAQLARDVLAALDLDRAQHIVLPFRIGALPDGVDLTAAYVGFSGDVYSDGGVFLRSADGATMEVQAQHSPAFASTKRANHTVGEREAFLYPGLDEMELLGFPGLYLSARIGKQYRGFGVADADTVLGGVTVASDVEDMATWPGSIRHAG